jgi:hypothetical protein
MLQSLSTKNVIIFKPNQLTTMKKLLQLSLLVLCTVSLMGLYSCDPKNKTQEAAVPDTEAVAESVGNLTVANSISADLEYMYLNYGSDYRWYETGIVLSDYLDGENQVGEIECVTNVFQVVTECDSGGADTEVIYIAHTLEGVQNTQQHGFWIEDFPLNDQSIKVTFAEAYNKVMSVNYPKPHSRHCVLRKQVGPINANPQYIFGNNRAQLYVDAVTGEVKDKNPAFDGSGFGCPLGEWP